ncbi:MAG: DUF308 domain-containing protein [Lachnospiraceae bacterium]|nr:DUF308 domain-containing protein [Lachnospiraceae bacterium]
MSKGKKAFLIILGILVAIGGIFCIVRPGMTFLSLIWFAGVMMFFYAIEALVTYSERKKMGLANTWSLISAILACICGFAIVISNYANILAAEISLYILFGWLIAAGLLSILAAFGIKKLPGDVEKAVEMIAGKWWIHVIIGILMIIAGIFGFVHPLISAMTIGLVVGVEIILSGIKMIASTFSA